jgi:hypothetical protein
MKALATHPGRIQERLGYAALEVCVLRMQEFPEDFRSIYQRVYDECTKRKSGEDTPEARNVMIQAVCDELTDEKATEIAGLIFRLYDDVGDWLRQPRE